MHSRSVCRNITSHHHCYQLPAIYKYSNLGKASVLVEHASATLRVSDIGRFHRHLFLRAREQKASDASIGRNRVCQQWRWHIHVQYQWDGRCFFAGSQKPNADRQKEALWWQRKRHKWRWEKHCFIFYEIITLCVNGAEQNTVLKINLDTKKREKHFTK